MTDKLTSGTKKKSPEIDPHIYSKLMYNKGAIATLW